MLHKDVQGARDQTYSAWHRRLSTQRFAGIKKAQLLHGIDFNGSVLVEYDSDTEELLGLIETAQDVGQKLKTAMVTRNLAGARMFPRTGCFTPFRLSTIRQRANFEQVKAGLAWHYKANQADQAVAYRERYAAAEISAGQANLLLSRG